MLQSDSAEDMELQSTYLVVTLNGERSIFNCSTGRCAKTYEKYRAMSNLEVNEIRSNSEQISANYEASYQFLA